MILRSDSLFFLLGLAGQIFVKAWFEFIPFSRTIGPRAYPTINNFRDRSLKLSIMVSQLFNEKVCIVVE